MKPIYIPKGKALEYADYALNIYTGCNHRCTYCYASDMHRRFHPEQPFEKVQPREGLLEALDRQLYYGMAGVPFRGKTVHLCFTCDPYPALPVDTAITREVIGRLKAAGCYVQILTKGGCRAMRDFDLLGPGDWFGATLTGFSAAQDEPNAAPGHERIEALYRAHEKGINTWASLEPVLHEEEAFWTIRYVDFVDQFRIGKLNYRPSTINWGAFGRECEQMARELGLDIVIKDDLRAEMERQP